MDINSKKDNVIELYRRAEDYFFKSISTKTLELEDVAIAYMTAVPVADLNILYIKSHTSNIDIILSQAKQFYEQGKLEYIIIIPEEFEVNKVFKEEGYSCKEQSVAMGINLQTFKLEAVTEDNIHANDDKLNDWASPMIAFSSTNNEISIKYMDTHKLAQKRKANLYHYSLYRQEQPISSITLSMNDNIARIDDVSTLAEFQGEGYATSLITYALLEAKNKGASYCFLEASGYGFSIYQKLGFKTLFKNDIYLKL